MGLKTQHFDHGSSRPNMLMVLLTRPPATARDHALTGRSRPLLGHNDLRATMLQADDMAANRSRPYVLPRVIEVIHANDRARKPPYRPSCRDGQGRRP